MIARVFTALALACALWAGAIPILAQTAAEHAWSILETGAADKNPDNRALAVRTLGIITRDPKAVGIAEKALNDVKPEVRKSGATALGVMNCTSCIGRLKVVLSDKDASVVLAAAHALWTLKDTLNADEVYYAVLTGKRKSGSGLISEGMDTLRDRKKMAQFGVEEGIGFIPFAGFGYSAVQVLRKDDVSPVRAAAAAILATDPDPKSGEALVKAASDKSWIVRAAALDALAKRGDSKVLENIIPLMEDKKTLVRYTAAAAVIQLSSVQKSAGRPKRIAPKRKKR
ncbi:MAG TPA: HEAT repeat domain-containing protein [Terriglobia bacterium]|nr:HEAT repeat domain-containing protein [Terriglobia bacterium]